MGETEERIVMTPCKRGTGHTTIRMDRVPPSKLDKSAVKHVAGGDHTGLIINKEAPQLKEDSPPELSLEFKVFLTNSSNNLHTQESRQLRFWFKPNLSDSEQMRCTQNFFKDLVNPSEFPRDYVGFLKKIMKLMQLRYSSIKRIEVELQQLGDTSEEPPRPNSSLDDSGYSSKSDMSQAKVLEVIESAYPSPISIPEIARTWQCSEEEVRHFIIELLSKGLIRCMENGAYIRVTKNDTEVKMVKQMPKVMRSQQPTIAIITAHFWEKVAVDAMIDNKDTYVRYKTEGESNVYTLGIIGSHRVVSTKLPAIGHSRSATIAAGSTTTRLLGTFQKVEYVFLVGVGGGVPHYTDASKHVRMGDVVISAPPVGINDNYIYMYVERLKGSPTEGPSTSPERYNIKTWSPPNFEIQHVGHQLWIQGLHYPDDRPWEGYINNGLRVLRDAEADFSRPPPGSDRLYMALGGKDLIEVNHPALPEGDPRAYGMPALHFGAVGCGRTLMKDDAKRMEFAAQHGIVAFDTEFDTVVESIYGNRKDNYVFIRGIADYKDGSKRKEWQPHAALCAAGVMKAIIMALDPIDDD